MADNIQVSKSPASGDQSSFSRKERQNHAATGASAAGVRALGVQAVAFFFRAPAKAFFRSRIDYLVFARAINPRAQAQEGWSIRSSTPGLLTHAVKHYGWSFIPNHVLPPLLANTGIGAALYTTYLQTLAKFYPPSLEPCRSDIMPPPPTATFCAGACAGMLSSLVAAPIDAIAVRFKPSDLLSSISAIKIACPTMTATEAAASTDPRSPSQPRYSSMWSYGYHKLRSIGLRGVLAGLALNTVKDSLGFGVFFMTFEYIKGQGYLAFAQLTASGLRPPSRSAKATDQDAVSPPCKPHFTIEPTFLLLAGLSATITQQAIAHPLSRVQTVYYHTRALFDRRAHSAAPAVVTNLFARTIHVYKKTWLLCLAKATAHTHRPRLPYSNPPATIPTATGPAIREEMLLRWMYKDFWRATVRQVPSTSAGLIVFELVRRWYGVDSNVSNDAEYA